MVFFSGFARKTNHLSPFLCVKREKNDSLTIFAVVFKRFTKS
ncbi:MAG: hypothetical protein U5L45_05815 [Saprospiraceae bacterium]|nr:hypothetical protein [Saprospiraceae bacterium]